MTTQERVSLAIRLHMAAQRRSQADVARVLGITPPSVSQKFSGRSRWSVDDLDKLAAAFDVPVTSLFEPPSAFLGVKSATHRERTPAGQGAVLLLPLHRTAFRSVAA